MNSSNEYGSSSQKGTESKGSSFPADATGRLIDEIANYLRARHQREEGMAKMPVDEDRLLRAAIHQLRIHPVPTAVLGISAIWLLLADDREDEEEAGSHPGRRFEEEVVAQIKGGYSYTGKRLRELVDHYPWAAAGVLVAGGLGAALLLPGRRRRVPVTHDEPGAFAEEPSPRDEFDLGSPGEDEEPPRA